MSALDTNLSVLRASLFSSAPSTCEAENSQGEALRPKHRGGCIRGFLWALALEAAGLLAGAFVFHAWRALHLGAM